MDSDLSANRRTPQQARGERRVAELLEAAASEFAEVGYDAATMKAIAKRAGASIGAVYQYFPNKEAIVSALRTQYVNEMEKHWIELEKTTSGSSIKNRTNLFIDGMIHFMEEHPAYIAILDAPVNSKRDRKTRDRLCERLADLFRARRLAVTQDQAHRVARISLQMIKGMNALHAEANPQERPEIVKEYKLALMAYLEKRLT
jgi:AcrR family transcriptional regulator